MKCRVHRFDLHRGAPVSEILLEALLVTGLARDHPVFERHVDRAVKPFPVPDISLVARENGNIAKTLCFRADLRGGLDEFTTDLVRRREYAADLPDGLCEPALGRFPGAVQR